jgi:hypothetical protein
MRLCQLEVPPSDPMNDRTIMIWALVAQRKVLPPLIMPPNQYHHPFLPYTPGG